MKFLNIFFSNRRQKEKRMTPQYNIDSFNTNNLQCATPPSASDTIQSALNANTNVYFAAAQQSLQGQQQALGSTHDVTATTHHPLFYQ